MQIRPDINRINNREVTKASDCAVIGLFGDDPGGYMAKCGTRWMQRVAGSGSFDAFLERTAVCLYAVHI